MKNNRNLPGNNVQDPATIANLTYSEVAGAQKNTDVGRHLIPIAWISGGVVVYTTDATTAKALSKKGANLAVYNTGLTLQSITLGESGAVASLASGATDAAGHVGLACKPGDWAFFACGESNFVISSNAALLVYIIDDETSIKQEAKR